jgi:hypothetical protein
MGNLFDSCSSIDYFDILDHIYIFYVKEFRTEINKFGLPKTWQPNGDGWYPGKSKPTWLS